MPKKFIKSFSYAQAGAVHALRTQRNIWIHLAVAIVVLAVAIYCQVTTVELAILVLTVTTVIVAEMLNTAIEIVVDHLSPEFREEAGLIKNVAAGAVLLAAAGAVAVGWLVLFPRIWRLYGH
jgi:diacylglycerol kinase (ATP)